jgi:hypothetical protein
MLLAHAQAHTETGKSRRQNQMKKRIAGVVSAGALTLVLALGLATSAQALPLFLAVSQPVLMIDGIGDVPLDLTVNLSITSLNPPGIDFGYVTSGSFIQLAATASFAGGSVVDFAIRDTNNSNAISKLSDGTAQMFFSGDVMASNSEMPSVPFDYWQGLTLTWPLAGNDLVINLGGEFDGFAPQAAPAPVPEPGAMAMFAVGLLVVRAGARRS